MNIKKALLVATLVLTPAFGQAQPIRVIDGDTIRAGGEVIRIVGLDAPELRGRCEREKALARRARMRVEGLALRGLTIERRSGRDKYGRTLAVVRDSQSGLDVAAILIREGLARPYDGRGRREGWC